MNFMHTLFRGLRPAPRPALHAAHPPRSTGSSPTSSFSSPLVRLLAAIGLLALLVATGCASGPGGLSAGWPTAAALPDAPPADLDRDAATSTLRRGSDGLWYVVGGLGRDTAPGSPFFARYAGEWPLESLPRPALAGGHVLTRFDDDVALVALNYWLPESPLDDLEVTWEESLHGEQLGKGLGLVTAVDFDTGVNIDLSMGEEVGVQRGDIYAILRPARRGAEPASLQLSRRLVAICMVNDTNETAATCRQWAGHPGHPHGGMVEVGHEALFLEHTFGKSPRDARVLVGTVTDGADGAATDARAFVLRHLEGYATDLPSSHTRVEPVDRAFAAVDIDFHRNSRHVEYDGHPTIIVGLSVHRVDGRDHLFANYTGVGPASGPGMIAAPPEAGVDLGPLASPDPARVRALSAVVLGAVMSYRGQTSEALMHLHSVLSDTSVDGPLRWHARDQYAMRWGGLGYFEEALWLVLQDEAVARARDDRQAELNAIGTRVRLYDLVEENDAAYDLAARYLEARQDQKPNSAYLAALGMYGEMALGAGHTDRAAEVYDELLALCPDGCDSDLVAFIGGMFWAATDIDDALQARILTTIVEQSRSGDDGSTMASARLLQGMMFMREGDLEQALIAFLESERLFTRAHYTSGIARAHFFMMLTQLARSEPQEAFDHGLKAIELNTELRDFGAAARVYERMAALYSEIDFNSPPRPYLGAARRVLSAAVEAQLAQGNYARAAEAMFAMASFLFKIGSFPESQVLLQQGVWYGVRSARFDVVALSHLFLGVIARNQGDMDTFAAEIGRARLMAQLSGDPDLMELIENAISPPAEDDVPTKLL